MDNNNKPGRIGSLQAVRAMAFTGIFLCHAINTFPGEGMLYYVLFKSPGVWGVSVFFVLSGFLMTYSYWNRPIGKKFKDSFLFMIRKIRKLYPLHLLMLLAGSVYWLMMQRETISGILKKLAITVPLIQTWFPVGYQGINSVAWYLSACVFLYFCFPCLLGFIKRIENIKLLFAVISGIFIIQLLIGYGVFRYTLIDMKWITYCHPVFRLGDFTIGGFMASLYIKRKASAGPKRSVSKLWGSVLEMISVALSIATCIFYTYSSDESVWYTYTCLFIPSSVLLVYVFSMGSGIISGLLTNRFTLWLAAISPYAFLIHRLVIYYLQAFTKYIIHCESVNILMVIVVSFGSTVIAVLMYQKFEKAVIQQLTIPKSGSRTSSRRSE